jgi:hypothetical protein
VLLGLHAATVPAVPRTDERESGSGCEVRAAEFSVWVARARAGAGGFTSTAFSSTGSPASSLSSASRALIRPVRAPESLISAELFLGRPITLFGIRTGLSGIPFVHYDLFDSTSVYDMFCAAKNDSNLLCIDARWQARHGKAFQNKNVTPYPVCINIQAFAYLFV